MLHPVRIEPATFCDQRWCSPAGANLASVILEIFNFTFASAPIDFWNQMIQLKSIEHDYIKIIKVSVCEHLLCSQTETLMACAYKLRL